VCVFLQFWFVRADKLNFSSSAPECLILYCGQSMRHFAQKSTLRHLCKLIVGGTFKSEACRLLICNSSPLALRLFSFFPFFVKILQTLVTIVEFRTGKMEKSELVTNIKDTISFSLPFNCCYNVYTAYFINFMF